MKKHTLRKSGLLGLVVLFVSVGIPLSINAQSGEDVLSILEEGETYVAGEVLVKFKEGIDPQAVLQEVNLQVTSTERIYSTAPAVARFRKDYKIEKDKDGWYWFRGKNYKAVEEIPNEEFFQEASQQMDPTERGLYRSYKITLAEGISVEEAVVELENNAEVEYAEPNYIMELYMVPNDPYYYSSGSWGQSYDDLWGIKKINAEVAWDISQGEGVVVAVIDSGIDYTHEDLVDNIWINEDEIPNNGIDDDGNGYVDDIYGYDFAYGDNDPMDGGGHGTHCAGTIAAVANNSIGVIGVAPRAKIMAVKGFNDSGSGYTDDLVKCIKYAADNGAVVLSNSWGGLGSYQALTDAFSNAHNKGCVSIAAAGNSNTDVKYFKPANIDTVIAVAASTQNDERCLFSNYGYLIDVAAPGGGYDNESGQGWYDIYNILSTLPDDSVKGRSSPDLKISDGYYRLAGTSMACPHVTGLAAVIKAMYPEESPYEIRSRILAGADNIDALNPDFEGLLGTGRINVENSLMIEPRPFPKIVKLEKNNFEAGEDGSVVIHVQNLGHEASLIGVTLITNSQWAAVQSSYVVFNDVKPGETRINSDNPFIVSVSPACPFGTEIDFNLTLTYVDATSSKTYEEMFPFIARVAFFKDVGDRTGLLISDPVFSSYVAMEDYNNDNYPDAYFAGFEAIHLYRNRQDGTFVEAENEAGIDAGSYPILFLDINNDGHKDLFQASAVANRLYLNNGDGTFTDISSSSGDIGNTTSQRAIAFDYNNDGFVDICAADEVEQTWNGYQWRYSGGELYLLRNNGDCSFTKVKEEAALPTTMSIYRLCQMVSLDYDNDGNQDLLVSNVLNANTYILNYDYSTIRLYRNNGDGTFTDVAVDSGIPPLLAASGVATGDYNNDGYMDIFLTNRPTEDIAFNALFRNNGDGTFTDVTKEAGDIDFEKQAVGCGGIWGTDFFDYDNDGNLDLYVTSRHESLASVIYRNNGDGTFINVSKTAFPEDASATWAGAAIGDYNNDGALDIYAPASIALGILGWTDGAFLENLIGKENNWIKINLEDKTGERCVYGARVYVKTGGLTQTREVHTGAVETLPLHFGLGQATVIDEIEVHWSTTGEVTKTYNVNVNQLITLYPAPAPYISSIYPDRGAYGRYVRIYGKDFGQRNDYSKIIMVSPDGTDIDVSPQSWSDSRITFYVPQLGEEGSYDLKVHTMGGLSNGKTFCYSIPPTVTIVYPASYATVPSTGFDFKGTAQDPSGVSEVRVYVYDYGRSTYTVANQLASYNEATQEWSFNVLSSHMTPQQYVLLYVRAKDTQGNYSYWQYKIASASILGDLNGDGIVDDFEVLDCIDMWAAGKLSMQEILEIIDNWSNPSS